MIEQRLSPDHLLCSHANRLDSKFSSTHVEQVLQAGPQEVDHEDVVEAFLSKVVDLRNSSCGESRVRPYKGPIQNRGTHH